MTNADKVEQWKLDGKCNICRRKNYCSKPCRACKSRREYEMRSAVSRVMTRAMMKGE